MLIVDRSSESSCVDDGHGLPEPGPSHVNNSPDIEQSDPNSQTRRRSRRRRRNRCKMELRPRKDERRKKVVCSSVESSPGRESPSPESLTRILLKVCHDVKS